MTNLHNTVTGLLFTVFRWSIRAYYVNNNLEFLLWNFYLTKFRLIKIPVWLSTENYYIWSFAAPVILITTVSTYQRLIPTVSWFRIHSTNIKSKQKNILSIRAFIQPIYLRSYLRGSLSLYIASILSWKKPGGPKLLDRGARAQTKIFRTDMIGMI